MGKPPSTKVMEIFSEAAGVDAALRTVFLDSACGADPDLRAEVESLLSTEQRLSGFLGSPTVGAGVGPGLGADPEATAGHDAIAIERGRALAGRYSIAERVGEGGFGVVYAALQNHPIRREVALKIVKLGMDTRQIIARFESERQALALMDHPGIARIFDAGATADGRPYFVMELVRGAPITEYCDANRLPIPKRLELFTAVCQAVQHAHQKGIIHRDLKPSNVLVAQVDGAPVPKVIDFGIAKAMETRPGEHTAYTEVRHFVGTPQYMSPEQAGEGGGDVDTRSDIYSLGVLLYELLTGATPFDAQALKQSSYERVNRIIREEDPPKPSARLSKLGPELSEVAERRGLDGPRLRKAVAGELEWVVAKAMEKDRRRRYETASALSDDVRRYLAHEPLRAGPPDTLYRVRKFALRHRRPLAAAAAVALALLVGLAGVTVGLVRAKHDRDRARAALTQAEQVSAFLAQMLGSADPDRAKGNQTVGDLLDRSSQKLDQGALRDQPLVEATIRMALGGAYEGLGQFSDSLPQVRRALTIRQDILGKENRETAQSMSAYMIALSNAADSDSAEAYGREALSIQDKLLGSEHPDSIRTLIRLAHILRGKGKVVEAEALLRRAIGLIGDSADPSRRGLRAWAYTNLGVVQMDKGAWEDAEKLLKEALDIDRELHGEKYRNVPRNLSNLAAVRQERGDYKGAESYWVEALRIQKEILPKDHQDIAWTLRLLGRLKRAQGEFATAETYLTDSLEMERRVYGPDKPIVAMVLVDVADVYRQQGRRAEAVPLRKQALDIWLAHEAAQLAARPASPGRRGAAGILHVRRAEFREADADLAEASRLEPDEPRWPAVRAALHAYLGDEAAYREARRTILDRFGTRSTFKSDYSDTAIAACLLLPPNAPEVGPITRLAAKASWFTQGLTALRTGDAARAAECLSHARDEAHGAAARAAAAYYLAVALRGQGKAAESAAALTVADGDFAKLLTPEDGDVGEDVEDWLVCQAARHEALVPVSAHPAGDMP